jgi:hypothetical protein
MMGVSIAGIGMVMRHVVYVMIERRMDLVLAMGRRFERWKAALKMMLAVQRQTGRRMHSMVVLGKTVVVES